MFLGAGVFLLGGCAITRDLLSNQPSRESKEISQLKKRVAKLEIQSKSSLNPRSRKDSKTPSGPIRSLTFRTTDDRLRIYWADGTKSDLPCTKEQSTWVCG